MNRAFFIVLFISYFYLFQSLFNFFVYFITAGLGGGAVERVWIIFFKILFILLSYYCINFFVIYFIRGTGRRRSGLLFQLFQLLYWFFLYISFYLLFTYSICLCYNFIYSITCYLFYQGGWAAAQWNGCGLCVQTSTPALQWTQAPNVTDTISMKKTNKCYLTKQSTVVH